MASVKLFIKTLDPIVDVHVSIFQTEIEARKRKAQLIAAREAAGNARKARSMATRTKDNLRDKAEMTLGKKESKNYDEALRKFQEKVRFTLEIF